MPVVNVPDFSLPAIDPEVALTVLGGALLGALTADVLLMLRSFSRRRTSRLRSVLGLAALVVGCLVFAALVDRGGRALPVAVAVAVPAGLAYGWALGRVGTEPDSAAASMLSDWELRRDKTRADRWVLVTGAKGSGKTALVGGMIAAERARLAGALRRARDGEVEISELPVRDPDGAIGRIRFWDAPFIRSRRGRLPSLDEFDAVVVTIEPALHTPIAESFPSVLRGGRIPLDANASILQLAGALPDGCLVWAVIAKADHLRLSVHPGLLSLPLAAGPDWHQQLRQMDVIGRHHLAEALELGQLTNEHQPAFRWGSGSPLVAFSGSVNGREAFGAAELMHALVDSLWSGWES